jgi:betaine-aldehyde dehydrogenase
VNAFSPTPRPTIEHILVHPWPINGGFKQSGLGREECFEEMLSFTQEKNIHVKLRPAK